MLFLSSLLCPTAGQRPCFTYKNKVSIYGIGKHKYLNQVKLGLLVTLLNDVGTVNERACIFDGLFIVILSLRIRL